nr:MAG TPA: hypothetical protein [Caudoviricetes sp.]
MPKTMYLVKISLTLVVTKAMPVLVNSEYDTR